MEDRELIHRIKSGEKDYLNEIAEKYYDDIYYFCCYQCGSSVDAYDLTQETFLRFIRYVEQYKYKNLKGYLLTIATNVCRNYFHKKGITESTDLETPKTDSARNVYIPETDLTAEKVAYGELARTLAAAVRQLPDNQREAVLLHHFYGYKNREIARMTGASYAAVKSRVNQGLAKLQQLLEKEDFYG